ncbi:WhiB family transcriptional regulator, redox-sensing transcriptional regulator [Frankia sp. AiPs1]|uniref:WhiB family transcriptional regulator n=1 Tax=Frankia sp. AiPa1 TaxID=573492 RepID=UPI002551F37E
MEHTDAGVHTVLADVERPAEHDPFGDHSDRVLTERHTQATAHPRAVPGTGVPGAGVGPARPGRPDQPVGSPSLGGPIGVCDPDRMHGGGRPEIVDACSAANVQRGGVQAVDVQADEDDLEDLADDPSLDDQVEDAGDLASVIDLGLGDLLGETMEWQERALCAQTDPEAFFPEKGGSTREAKRICSGCEVRAECLEYALENDERFGIWGGMSERERRKQRRRAV